MPKSFEGKSDVISFNNLSKTYNLAGSEDEKVVALKSVSLSNKHEFYSVKK